MADDGSQFPRLPPTLDSADELMRRVSVFSGNVLDRLETRERADTTANRPTATGVGQIYFDTTLGRPIWWNGTTWVDATGTAA